MRLLDYLYYRLFWANVRYWGGQETSRTVFGLSVWLWLLHLPLLVWSKIFCKADLRVFETALPGTKILRADDFNTWDKRSKAFEDLLLGKTEHRARVFPYFPFLS